MRDAGSTRAHHCGAGVDAIREARRHTCTDEILKNTHAAARTRPPSHSRPRWTHQSPTDSSGMPLSLSPRWLGGFHQTRDGLPSISYRWRFPSSNAVKNRVAPTRIFASLHDAGSRSNPPNTLRAGSMISAGEYYSAVALDVVAFVKSLMTNLSPIAKISRLLEDTPTFCRAGRDLRSWLHRLESGGSLTVRELARLAALERDVGRALPPGTRPVTSKPLTRQPDPPAWMTDSSLLPKRPPARG